MQWRDLFAKVSQLFSRKKRVLLVCRENICRSPMAQGLLQRQIAKAGLQGQIEVMSAGTHTTQPGSRPDKRAERAAALGGIDISKLRARRVSKADLMRSDLVLAMDAANLRDLRRLCPSEHHDKLQLLLDLSPNQGLTEVPDPYYGSTEGFETVFQLLRDITNEASESILDHIL